MDARPTELLRRGNTKISFKSQYYFELLIHGDEEGKTGVDYHIKARVNDWRGLDRIQADVNHPTRIIGDQDVRN